VIHGDDANTYPDIAFTVVRLKIGAMMPLSKAYSCGEMLASSQILPMRRRARGYSIRTKSCLALRQSYRAAA